MIYRLINPLKQYSWGSKSFIHDLCGIERDGKAIAEMWMGTHPLSPSMIESTEGCISLTEFINSDRTSILGDSAYKTWNELPFLFKVLAAEQALSIQVHPDATQAKTGYMKENSANVSINSPQRSYKDANHKPELLVALTDFTAMCGFRNHDQIIHHITASGLQSYLYAAIDYEQAPSVHSFSILFNNLLSLDPSIKQAVIKDVLNLLSTSAEIDDDVVNLCFALERSYPQDIGVLMPLFMNIIKLSPGEAIFLPACVIHSYVQGAALELMANSDNVLRCGLTDKHIDIEEFCSICSFESYHPQLIKPSARQTTTYSGLADEFYLELIKLPISHINNTSQPYVLLCLEGSCIIECVGGLLDLSRGQSCFVTADDTILGISGDGSIALARPSIRT